jgi:hypothetical protein
MSALARLRIVPPEDPDVDQRAVYAAPALKAIRSAVVEIAPASEQPLWRRLLYISLAAISLALILPQPAVVSDVTHAPAGFKPFLDTSAQQLKETVPNVWLVDRTESYELYSNGLRVDNTYSVQNEHRFYQVLDRSNNMQPGTEWNSAPAGIVYHATESPQFPFDREQSVNIMRVGRALASQVQEKRSYHFLIDRFGQVFRIVEETDAANHAGNSVWGDGRSVYLNLNSSFLGVAFETAADAQTGVSSITNAQANAGKNLTQMLRSKYKLPAQNCITHAQVSVNPLNMRIGYHTDLASRFPFAEMGLPNNYDLPLASLSEFGFDYDDLFRKAVGDSGWRGITVAERNLERAAAGSGISVDHHRQQLRDRYKRLYSALKLTGAVDEQPAPTRQ